MLGERCPVELAEELFAWLVGKPTRKIDASACQDMHTAVLQVLLLCRPKLIKMPQSPLLQQALSGLIDA
ncbi:MAG: hypothetical protein IE928_05475 [Gammaproteobacteria bacterium]|nr:hypothetical protein [Gammaproteobacteria bacterium]